MNIQVNPTPFIPEPRNICSFNYFVNSLVLNSSITIKIVLLDANNNDIKVSQVTLSGEDYANWGNDDNYLIDYICRQLGLTQLSSSKENPIVVEENPIIVEENPIIVEENSG